MLTLIITRSFSQSWLGRPNQIGGNRRLPTFSICPVCRCLFGPLRRLEQAFCSRACKVASQRTGRQRLRKTTAKARSAQSLLRYHIKAGHIIRPERCEECGASSKKIEGAHFNYDEPLRVRWLCRACHVRWDKREPKNATYVVHVNSERVALNENAPVETGACRSGES